MGFMRIVVMTGRRSSVKGGLKRGRDILISFRSVKRPPVVETILVGRKGLEFLSFDPVGGSLPTSVVGRFTLRVEDVAVKVARKNAQSLYIPSFLYLTELVRFDPLFHNSFCAMLTAHLLSKWGLVFPFKERVTYTHRVFELWELVFLPVLAGVMVRDFEDILSYNLSPRRTPRECVNCALSYLVGSNSFYLFLTGWIELLRKLGVLHPYRSEAHGGLSANSCELSELGKGV